jgi:hypothetical protein
MPLRNHEMMYIFNKNLCINNDDVELTRNKDMREYAEKVKNYINKPYSQIKKDFGNSNSEHFINRSKSSQFSLPTIETYNKLIELYKIDKMDGFINFDDLEFENVMPNTYNPQKTEGKPYKVKGSLLKNKSGYGESEIPTHENETGQRHPKSVLTDIKITDEESPKTTIMSGCSSAKASEILSNKRPILLPTPVELSESIHISIFLHRFSHYYFIFH